MVLKLAHAPTFNRVMRMDDITTIGVSTQTMCEELIAEELFADAQPAAAYFAFEIRTMARVQTTWIRDLIRQVAGPAGPATLSDGLVRGLELFDAGAALLPTVRRSLDRGDAEAAITGLEQMRQEYRAVHDLHTTWIQDLLTLIGESGGEDAVRDAITETYDRIWGRRFRQWPQMSVWERVAFTCEAMRGHLSGRRRRGDLEVREEADRYVFVFDPCGSGGVLRGGDPETGRGPLQTAGVNGRPHDWTGGHVGMPWYCTHCPLTMEWLPVRRGGPPTRPVRYDVDPNGPSMWFVYKDLARTPEEHFAAVGGRPHHDVRSVDE